MAVDIEHGPDLERLDGANRTGVARNSSKYHSGEIGLAERIRKARERNLSL